MGASNNPRDLRAAALKFACILWAGVYNGAHVQIPTKEILDTAHEFEDYIRKGGDMETEKPQEPPEPPGEDEPGD